MHRAGPAMMAVLGDEHGKTPLFDVLQQAGISPDDVRYAVMTHAHWDHVGALGDLPTRCCAQSTATWADSPPRLAG